MSLLGIDFGFSHFGRNAVLSSGILLIFLISAGVFVALFPFYSTVLVLCIPFVLILFKNLQAALLVYLFVLPLVPGVVAFSIGALPVITLQRVLLLFILIIWFAKKIITKKPIPRTPLDKFIVLLVLTESLAVIISFDIGVSFLRFFGDIIEYFALYYIVVDIIRSKEDIRKVVTTLLLGSFVAGSFGATEALTGVNFFRDVLLPNADWDWLATYAFVLPTGQIFHRIQGPFGHPIEFGHYIVLLFPIALVAFKNALTRWKRYGQLLNLILLLSNLVATVARGAIVGFLTSLLVVQARARRGLVVAAAVLLAVVMLSSATRGYLGSLGELILASVDIGGPTTSANVSLVSKLRMAEAGIQEFTERPLVGHGLNASRKGLGTDSPFLNPLRLYAMENYYLALLIDGGLLLFISQTLLYTAIVANMWRICRRLHRTDEDKDLLMGLIASSLGLFVALLTVNAYPHVLGLFWALAALGMRVVINKESREENLA